MPELPARTHRVRIHRVRQLISKLPEIVNPNKWVRVDGYAGIAAHSDLRRASRYNIGSVQTFRWSGDSQNLIPVLLVLRPFLVVDVTITDTKFLDGSRAENVSPLPTDII